MATELTYNSYDLQDANIITGSIDDGGTPERVLPIFNLVRGGGSVITSSNYYTKSIKVTGKIIDSSVANLEARIDAFHAALSEKDKNLDIAYGSSTRRYIATPAKVSVVRPVRASPWANFEIDFLCTELGKDTSVTALLTNEVVTTNSFIEPITVGGSSPEQFLRIEITITDVTPSTTNTVSVRNDTTGQQIDIFRGWADGEVLEIDTLNKTVTVDGEVVDYSGAFPVFSPGAHDLVIETDFVESEAFTSSDSWVAPAGVTEAVVEAWGAGGAGGGRSYVSGDAAAGAGGGGGAYARKTVTVTPAASYSVVVGAGGTGDSDSGAVGGDSTFATTTVVAKGGFGGGGGSADQAESGGSGGQASASTGDVKYDGGNGGSTSGIVGVGGAGGGGAGSTSAGNAGENGASVGAAAGGAGSGEGGTGGAGRTSASDGDGGAGSTIGGGGGGAFTLNSPETGGNGARGEVRVTWGSVSLSVDVDYIKRYL